jgi:hypothetical protein
MTVAFIPDLAGYRDAFAFVLLIVHPADQADRPHGRQDWRTRSDEPQHNAFFSTCAGGLPGVFSVVGRRLSGRLQDSDPEPHRREHHSGPVLNLIYGFTGMFSLGHAGFMAIGAYVCAMLISDPDRRDALHPGAADLAWFQCPGPLFGGRAAGRAGGGRLRRLIGFPVLRLGGDYLGIATLGFAEIVRVLANNLPRVTNGALGFKGIPDHANLWWNYAWCLLTLYCIRIVRSNFGQRPEGHPRRRDRGQVDGYQRLSSTR